MTNIVDDVAKLVAQLGEARKRVAELEGDGAAVEQLKNTWSARHTELRFAKEHVEDLLKQVTAERDEAQARVTRGAPDGEPRVVWEGPGDDIVIDDETGRPIPGLGAGRVLVVTVPEVEKLRTQKHAAEAERDQARDALKSLSRRVDGIEVHGPLFWESAEVSAEDSKIVLISEPRYIEVPAMHDGLGLVATPYREPSYDRFELRDGDYVNHVGALIAASQRYRLVRMSWEPKIWHLLEWQD
jgi:hypothetical protein